MPICMIIENPEQDREKTDKVIAHVRSTGSFPPEGARLAMGGPADPGWRFISVWDSQEALERFYAERLTPAYTAAGMTFDTVTRTLFEVGVLAAGDLTGAPQQA